jgi:dihydroorotate dehydrogenase
MNYYKLLRPLLFSLPPEAAHHLSLALLKLMPIKQQVTSGKPIKAFGLDFPNPIGLAAGLDKNGDYIHALAKLGFGFLEIGTVTPRAQKGNPRPRLFRLTKEQAIINRMGFNNKGVDYLINQVTKTNYAGILGINIGKNFDTSLEDAHKDYCLCLEKVFTHASYITVNISSPNTPGLRDLQAGDALESLLETLKQKQLSLSQQHNKTTPLLVKLAPDMDEQQISEAARLLIKFDIDGVIATNTTITRPDSLTSIHKNEQGGLSGKPLTSLSTKVIGQLHQALNGAIPIIGVGGINSADDAKTKLNAGATLIQIYSGLIYQGAGLIQKAVKTAF